MAQWLRCCVTNRKVVGSIPAGAIGFFIDMKSFRSHYGPGVDSSSNRNEYQEHFLGVKAALRTVMLTTLPPSCAVVMKFGSLNFLEPSGPLHACKGTDFYLSDLKLLCIYPSCFASLKMATCLTKHYVSVYKNIFNTFLSILLVQLYQKKAHPNSTNWLSVYGTVN